MKIVIAQMQHETNTFSPVPTPWEAFGNNGPYLGRAGYEAMKGTRLAMAAFLDLAEAAGAQIVTPVVAWANPSGPVDAGAYDRICDLICDAVAKGCDAIMLDLHGAMVVQERTDDGEGTLLEKIRAIAPRTPIAVSLDLHANVTERMVSNCNVIAGYKTYPHVDQYESGRLAGALMSMPSVKAVEIGEGVGQTARRGSTVHDVITFDQHEGWSHESNNAGGIEGGMTNGAPVVVRGSSKPIATIIKTMRSVDLKTREPAMSHFERSDICVIPAAGVV